MAEQVSVRPLGRVAMARARNIKPSFFQNDALADIHPLGRLLFVGMWTISDFKGCLEYRPKRIKAQLLAYDECDTESLLMNLDKSGFISIYSVRGVKYIKIVNFEKHQNPHKNERESGSDIPDIDEKDSEISELKQDGTTPDKNGTAPADSLLLIPDSPILNPSNLIASVTPAEKISARKSSPEAQEVFDYWQQQRGHERAKLDEKRQKAIKARLKDGYTVGDLCRAVDGISKSSYHMGQNDSRMVYDDIELICRTATNVDKFAKLAEAQQFTDPGLQHQVDILQQWMDKNDD
jgi:uncharacterized phage protein (TIGR02220 family)